MLLARSREAISCVAPARGAELTLDLLCDLASQQRRQKCTVHLCVRLAGGQQPIF